MKVNFNRKIALDIETTGLNNSGLLYTGHKIIEIGAIEIVNRKLTGNDFHVYLNPERKINAEAFKIHGISDVFLHNKPKFSEVYLNLINYIGNSDILVHNAEFDISFLNYEIKNIDPKISDIGSFCKIIDTLVMARKIFPGKKNSLDALSKRYNIKNIERKLHSAVIDAKILSKIYLRMTSIQKAINLDISINKNEKFFKHSKNFRTPLRVLKASTFEKEQHRKYLKNMDRNKCLWMT